MNAYYRATIGQFLGQSNEEIIGILSNKVSQDHYQLKNSQNFSWQQFLDECQQQFSELVKNHAHCAEWSILLEYKIPRIASRIDMIIIASDLLMVVEYKAGEGDFDLSYIRQLQDYCLDLHDFHKESSGKKILPLLLLSQASVRPDDISDHKLIKPMVFSSSNLLAENAYKSFKKYSDPKAEPINPYKWDRSEYYPTPTIIEAAQSLFAGQGVQEISQSHAGAKNLTITTQSLLDAIEKSRINNEKTICFVTGVPGAGKTLVGLNIVHKEDLFKEGKSVAAYFSGNGPLIKVLREALARDKYFRLKKNKVDENKKLNIGSVRRDVRTHIQNLHSFISDLYNSGNIPPEKIAIFDEAQRCWNAEHFYRKNSQNQNRTTSTIYEKKSEPELLLEIMDRHKDWSVMIALVGGGQEINTGEAGIGEWGRVIKDRFKHWNVLVSPELLEGDDSVAGNKLFSELPKNITYETNPYLHLNVSRRSYKAKEVTEWVNAVLANEPQDAKKIFEKLQTKFPIKITRDLGTAKYWLNKRQSGSRRTGLIASSGALRLKPYGINVKEPIDEPRWFLDGPEDVRSSFYLEIPATEFGIQGLEIDWAGLCWDLDLRRSNGKWVFKRFRGSKWTEINKPVERVYTINKYRVLLTRAREGLIIWIPDGSKDELYGKKQWYDEIANYLKDCGVLEI